MRTSKEIIDECYQKEKQIWSAPPLDPRWRKFAQTLINEARKEAIEECAERATTVMGTDINSNGEAYDIINVDKQSILSLINEIQ